jgi:hypothetical protein
LKKLAFLLCFVAIALAMSGQAWATYTIKTSKQITLQFLVTPSPTPVGYDPSTSTSAASAIAISRASGFDTTRQLERIAQLMQPNNPLDQLVAWMPMRAGDMVAQSAPEGNVKVQFTVKPDPNFAFFHIVPGAGGTSFNAGYGSNTYTCAYQVFAKYATQWIVSDWVAGTNTSGGTLGVNVFPTYNYPTTSNLSWLAETITTSFKAFANAGSPGETTFTGTAGQSKTACIDLTLNVPNTIPAGTYQTTIQYNLQIWF